MRILSGLCLFIALWAGPVLGRDIYVDNVAGNDRSTGRQATPATDLSGPVQTIAKALRLAEAGDTVVLAKTGSPYCESISLVGNRHSGTAQQPFMIRGNGATLDGAQAVPRKVWESYRGPVFRFRPLHVGYQQLYLNGRPAVRVVLAKADSPSADPPELKPLQWCSLGGYIYFCVEQTKLPADYRLTYACQQTGITLSYVEYATISDLTVEGFQLDGINLANTARRVSLFGVTCRRNGRSGVTVGGASSVALENCHLADNGEAQLLTLPHSETHLRDTKLSSKTAPGWVDQGGRVYPSRPAVDREP